MRPSTYFLFRPGLLVLVPFYYLLHRFFDSPLLALLLVVLNATVFGATASGLRKGFLALLAVLLILSYVALLPSDTRLERQFATSKPDFERLIRKASQTPSVVKIGNAEIEDNDGRKYRQGDRQVPLSAESWSEYREIFNKTGMKNGLHRTQAGEVQFLGHTIFGKIGPIGTLYGMSIALPHPALRVADSCRVGKKKTSMTSAISATNGLPRNGFSLFFFRAHNSIHSEEWSYWFR
jgi:hypothetical protein